LSKVQCSHIVTFVNLLGRLLIERLAKKNGHILIDMRQHLSVLDVRSFRAEDCDIEHYLVMAEVKERLALSKRTTHRVHAERFILKKLNEVGGKGQYRVEI
jgi:hypothetical protein